MKKLLTITLITFLLSSMNLVAQPIEDSVAMGNGYANNVFYSMQNGEIADADNTGWDIAFDTRVLTAAILTNGPSGVELYTYPNADTSGWNAIDTTGIGGWTPMFNSPYDWEDGAFNRNSGEFPDYGWGKYNMATHNLVGDSVYVIKLSDESWKKIWIVKKLSSLNTYVFRVANLDNSDEQEITIDNNDYISKQLVYYSLTEMKVKDLQPAVSELGYRIYKIYGHSF